MLRIISQFLVENLDKIRSNRTATRDQIEAQVFTKLAATFDLGKSG